MRCGEAPANERNSSVRHLERPNGRGENQGKRQSAKGKTQKSGMRCGRIAGARASEAERRQSKEESEAVCVASLQLELPEVVAHVRVVESLLVVNVGDVELWSRG